MTDLVRALAANPGVHDVRTFEPVEKALKHSLPADYRGFLMRTNGGETLPPLPRFRFYPLDELLVRRADGQPPGVLEFGTDDSDGFAFDLERARLTADYSVVRYPLGDTTRDDVEEVTDSFASFVERLSRPSEF